jgi:hypothetical protein
MRLWLVSAVILPLVVSAAAADGQPLKIAPDPPPNTRTINLRITQTYSFDPFPRRESGIIAETSVMPGARLGFGLVAVERRRPGPSLRLDGKPERSRKPAVSFVWKF